MVVNDVLQLSEEQMSSGRLFIKEYTQLLKISQ